MAAQLGRITKGFLAGVLEDHVTGFPGIEAGDAGEFIMDPGGLLGEIRELAFELRALKLEVLGAIPEAFLLRDEAFELLIDKGFALVDATFAFIQFEAATRLKLVGLFAELLNLLIGEEPGLPPRGFSLLAGLGEEILGAFLHLATEPVRLAAIANEEENGARCKQSCAAQEQVNRPQIHGSAGLTGDRQPEGGCHNDI
jgi:hypothetical protein